MLLHAPDPCQTIYSTGETWGLPLALVGACQKRRQFVHVTYAHRVFSPRWLWFLKTMRRSLAVDGWICVTVRQAEFLRKVLGKADNEIVAIPQGVDTQFFNPAQAVRTPQNQSYVLCIGAEMRDYGLLFDAVRGRGIKTVVKASSAWMVDDCRQLSAIPEDVDVITRSVSYVELRELYAGASLVVVPLRETLQAAGITTILESMAMQKCVVATKSPGLPDVLEHGNTGVIVESQAESFGQMIARLLVSNDQREELAVAGRRAVESSANIEVHVERIVEFLSARNVG